MRKARMARMFVIAATLTACGESSAGPGSQAATSETSVGGGVSTSLTRVDTIRFDIVIDPSRASTFYLGAGNSLVFPAGSVCDAAKTNYGEGQWDKPCTAARSNVTEHVKAWLDPQGHPRTDFSPDLRFVPSTLPSQWVNLSFADFQASLDPMFAILYCKQDKDKKCTDESLKDPSLVTLRNAVTGKVTRRIKHFSGYMVGAGDDSSGTGAEMNKVHVGARLSTPAEVGTGGKKEDRTGYMLASGRQQQR